MKLNSNRNNSQGFNHSVAIGKKDPEGTHRTQIEKKRTSLLSTGCHNLFFFATLHLNLFQYLPLDNTL